MVRYSKGLLSNTGLLGWDAQEPAILAALVADLPILLYGSHGQAKTQGAKAIARSLLGSTCTFQAYDYSRCTQEQIMGVLNPVGLTKGKLEYIKSPHTVWGADAVLFDEFNIANVMMGSMIHELLLEKTILGQETSVKLTFAAANPPDVYETNYVSLPTASRFFFISVPSANDLLNPNARSKNLERVLLQEEDVFESPPETIKNIVHHCRNVIFNEKSKKEIAAITKTISEALNQFNGIIFSTRQSVYLYKLILACEKLKAIGYPLTEADLCYIVLSIVPEITGLVATASVINYDTVKQRVNQIIVGMSVGDPILSGASIIEILKGDRTDLMGWAGAVCMLAERAEIKELRKSLKILKKLRKTLRKRPDIFNTMFHTILLRFLEGSADIKGALPPSVRKKQVTKKTITKLIQEI